MQKKWSTKTLITTAMLAAVAGVLMSFEFSVPMMPPFYKIDFSDVPSVIAVFLVGPSSAACIEILKIIIKLVTVGTNSMYVGELSNLLGVVLYLVPISFVYQKLGKNNKAAITALSVNIPIRTAFACFLNAFVTLPLYAKAMGISLDAVVQTVGAVNPWIKNLPSFVILATIPFNLIKLLCNYTIGYALYTRLKAAKVWN